MLLRRSFLATGRRLTSKPIIPVAPRPFTTSVARRAAGEGDPKPGEPDKKMVAFEDIKSEEDLLPPGAEPGTIPTDLDQSTGLERFEILGKMQGVDVFDMKPLDASRKGTEPASDTANSFILVGEDLTLVGTTPCQCGAKTWRACAGGGWCFGEMTWKEAGTKTERELREYLRLRALIEKWRGELKT